jgi:LmbE family N-acetylglucosaminyl deacetylase
MNIFEGQVALFLAPHTDDVELGCGATLARCVAECASVEVAVFSSAVQSLPERSQPDRLKNEFVNSMKIFGITEKRLHVYDYEVRKFNYFRQDILENLITLRREINPTLVFTVSGNDVHQDHQVIANESLRAFKGASILAYELPWNIFEFSPRVCITVSEQNLLTKLEALSEYKSQIEKKRDYFDREFIRSLARVRGIQAASDFAEAFELVTLKV